MPARVFCSSVCIVPCVSASIKLHFFHLEFIVINSSFLQNEFVVVFLNEFTVIYVKFLLKETARDL